MANQNFDAKAICIVHGKYVNHSLKWCTQITASVVYVHFVHKVQFTHLLVHCLELFLH